MTIAKPLQAPFDWNVVDGKHAQLALRGRIDVDFLSGNWTKVR
jgi:hypothetical protein